MQLVIALLCHQAKVKATACPLAADKNTTFNSQIWVTGFKGYLYSDNTQWKLFGMGLNTVEGGQGSLSLVPSETIWPLQLQLLHAECEQARK